MLLILIKQQHWQKVREKTTLTVYLIIKTLGLKKTEVMFTLLQKYLKAFLF